MDLRVRSVLHALREDLVVNYLFKNDCCRPRFGRRVEGVCGFRAVEAARFPLTCLWAYIARCRLDIVLCHDMWRDVDG